MKFLFDTHSHIQFPVYDIDREQVIERAKNFGIKMIAVGTQFSTSQSAVELAKKCPEDIWATVGFHPTHATHAQTSQTERGLTQNFSRAWYHDSKEQKEPIQEKFDIKRLRELARDPRVVAIGECGLDYFRLAAENTQINADSTQNNAEKIKNLQKEVFLQQAELAKELNKPLMIHCRPSKGTDDAYYDLLDMLSAKRLAISCIIHFHVGSLEITKKLVAAGFYFTFGGVITFARDYDEAVRYIPMDRILLETDCPYVAPLPYRGKRNEPAYIIETAKRMAELKNMDLTDLMSRISDNALKIFKLV